MRDEPPWIIDKLGVALDLTKIVDSTLGGPPLTCTGSDVFHQCTLLIQSVVEVVETPLMSIPWLNVQGGRHLVVVLLLCIFSLSEFDHVLKTDLSSFQEH